MKIRIIEPGWAGFTDYMGAVQFVDGVSVDDVSRADMQHLASLVQIETVEDEPRNPSIAQVLIDTNTRPAETMASPTASAPVAEVVPGKRYSPDELMAVADAKGIKGLREIADPLNVKANSIAELMGKILQVQEDQSQRSAEARQQLEDTELAENRAAEIAEKRAIAEARRADTGDVVTWNEAE